MLLDIRMFHEYYDRYYTVIFFMYPKYFIQNKNCVVCQTCLRQKKKLIYHVIDRLSCFVKVLNILICY